MILIFDACFKINLTLYVHTKICFIMIKHYLIEYNITHANVILLHNRKQDRLPLHNNHVLYYTSQCCDFVDKATLRSGNYYVTCISRIILIKFSKNILTY